MKPLTLEETGTKTDDNEMCIKGIDELPIFSWNTKTNEFYVLEHKFDGINIIEDFINYIHNLDKENKFLQSQLKAKEEENKQLKAINKEHERLNKENGRCFKITNVQEYNIYELLSYKKYKDNWNKLKEYIRKNIIYDDVGMKILDPSPLEDYIAELEQGSDSDE